MHTPKLFLVVLMAIAMWAYLHEASKKNDPGRSATSTEISEDRRVKGQILEDKTFETYKECDDAAKAAVQDLKDKGVSAALASRSPLAESTVYMVYYVGARGQISCRGGRLVNEILEGQ